VDENYDFALCARNLKPPPFRFRDPDRKALEDFTAEVTSQVDPEDLKALQDIIQSAR
jgi:hypothetical protein